MHARTKGLGMGLGMDYGLGMGLGMGGGWGVDASSPGFSSFNALGSGPGFVTGTRSFKGRLL